MKGNDDILKSIENLNNLVTESTKLSEKIPSLMDSLIEKVPEEQQSEVLKFVQESNELLNKSKKMDFNDVQSLIKDYKLKYEQSTNNK
jgi:uncharacterized protein YrrD